MRYFLANASKPLKCILAGNLLSRDHFLHQKRNIKENVLIMVREGILSISQNGQKYQVGPNQYIFLRAQEEHYGHQASDGKLSYLWVHFLIESETKIITEQKLFEDFDMHDRTEKRNKIYIIPEFGELSITQRATLLFNQLLDLSRQEKLYSDQITDYALSLLMMEISQEFIEFHLNLSQKISPSAIRIMEWIKGNYQKDLSVSKIAREFGYNTDYLSTMFRKSTQQTITGYINHTRIEVAKTLMCAYDLSVKEVAASSGFMDEKYFMKIFKKEEGMTPSQYKKAFSRKMMNT